MLNDSEILYLIINGVGNWDIIILMSKKFQEQ